MTNNVCIYVMYGHARLVMLCGLDLLVDPDPLSIVSMASSMNGPGRKSRGVEGTDRVALYLDVYGLLWTVQK